MEIATDAISGRLPRRAPQNSRVSNDRRDMAAPAPITCPWTGKLQQFDETGNRMGGGCPFMSKEQGMDFQVLVLGSATAERPHLINIKGYPAGLSVLDFLELAEAGKTFDKITLMEGLKWSHMVLRRATESTPMLRNSKLELAKGEKIVIEPRDFESLRIEMPDKKRPYLLSSLPKTFTLKEIKAAFIVLHNIPISEKRAAEVSMCARKNTYRKSDLTFSEPLGNHLNLYQLELNPDDRLVFNFRAPQYDDLLLNEGGEATSLLKDKSKRFASNYVPTWRDKAIPYVFWALVFFLIVSTLYVVFVTIANKNEFANTSIKFSSEAPTDEGERAHAAAMNGLRNLAGGGVGKNRK